MAPTAPLKSLRTASSSSGKTRRQNTTQTYLNAPFRLSKPLPITRSTSATYRTRKACLDLDLLHPNKTHTHTHTTSASTSAPTHIPPPQPSFSPLTAALDISVSPSFEIDLNLSPDLIERPYDPPATSVYYPSGSPYFTPNWAPSQITTTTTSSTTTTPDNGNRNPYFLTPTYNPTSPTSPTCTSTSSPRIYSSISATHHNDSFFEAETEGEVDPHTPMALSPVYSPMFTPLATGRFSPLEREGEGEGACHSPWSSSSPWGWSPGSILGWGSRSSATSVSSPCLKPEGQKQTVRTPLFTPKKNILHTTYHSRINKKPVSGNDKFCSLRALAKKKAGLDLGIEEEATVRTYMRTYLNEFVDFLATRAEEKGVSVVTRADVEDVEREEMWGWLPGYEFEEARWFEFAG